jgi:hypothetical protein
MARRQKREDRREKTEFFLGYSGFWLLSPDYFHLIGKDKDYGTGSGT